MVFCNNDKKYKKYQRGGVTILILIDGFLQSCIATELEKEEQSHNPYFNRWFSAISHHKNQRFWETSHNPYFNRWFSAIINMLTHYRVRSKSQSLF